MTRARRIGGVSAQAGNAAWAEATAAATSALLARATWPVTAPSAGLKTSARRPLWPGTTRPPIQCSMEAMPAREGDLSGAFMGTFLVEQRAPSLCLPHRFENTDLLITLFKWLNNTTCN